MWKRTPRYSTTARGSELLRECDALLSGGYGEYVRNQGRPAPAWALVNALAHASREELVAWAGDDAPPGNDPDAAGARQLLTFLADDVLSHAGPGSSALLELQRTRLVPLELDLMSDLQPSSHDPGRVTRLVMAAVRHPQRKPQR